MIKFTFLFLSVLLSTFSFCQQKEGHISYSITYSSELPELKSQLAMMEGSYMEVYFKNYTTKTELAMGTLMKMITISNSETDNLLMLMSGAAGERAVKTTIKEVVAADGDTIEPILKFENVTKEVLGFKCKKVTQTDQDGSVTIMWYTEDIAIDMSGQKNLIAKIPGVPLLYEISQNGVNMVISAYKMDKKIGKNTDEIFNFSIPEGYTEMTLEEMKSMEQ
jgi:hypothetical protein